ncbi:hypothetical protein HGRIS_002374 [Hohenbuehelia grisea]|uniref:Zn(2)-C6 fungal-type domain-containing protein n=1 Tax=Hohenbuehelia grisea TaxID=104357 RepID=A0ABR3JLE9_9AGAR
MDDSFQFIIESPQHAQGHKKRPRLVTSCDNCRLKKIKCLQPAPETKCEACKTAKIPCRFRDRERYFAERSRAIAGPTVASSYGDERSSSSPSASSNSAPRSNSHSPKASGLVSADSDYNARYTSYPPDPRRSTSSPHRHIASQGMPAYHSRGDSMSSYNFIPAGPAQLLQNSHNARSPYPASSRPFNLYDHEQPTRPNSSLMPHFIQLFFEHLAAEFAFLAYEEILAQFWEGTLPALLANCIAAMAARYSNLAELTVRGLHIVAESYAESAKAILSTVAHMPQMSTLHALMLIAWLEYKNNRVSAFTAYTQSAMSMAIDLGLSDQSTIQMNPSETERNRRRATWANIVQLHMTGSSIRP